MAVSRTEQTKVSCSIEGVNCKWRHQQVTLPPMILDLLRCQRSFFHNTGVEISWQQWDDSGPPPPGRYPPGDQLITTRRMGNAGHAQHTHPMAPTRNLASDYHYPS
jgi:hypothetical protein